VINNIRLNYKNKTLLINKKIKIIPFLKSNHAIIHIHLCKIIKNANQQIKLMILFINVQ